MKTVIFKSEGTYYMTSEENYNAQIQDARAIIELQDFNTPLEIIDYLYEYWGIKVEDLIIIEEGM